MQLHGAALACSTGDLVDAAAPLGKESIGPQAWVLRGFATGSLASLEEAIGAVAAHSPLRRWETPGGRRMSVAMTNCGARGWVSDRRGYRYDPVDPLTGVAWPAMPETMARLAAAAAAEGGFDGFAPDCCLINRYEPGTALSAHRDHDEADLTSPIVSVSLGAPATFLWGGLARGDIMQRIRLAAGDVVVWGGVSRLVFHGVARLPARSGVRLNVTFRSTGLG